ncbi:MAG: hypothetical protein ACO1NX_03705 [Chitinophagaceae bacterium]
MKTPKLLLLMTAGVWLLAACQKDINRELNETTDLVRGQWKVDSIVINQNISGVSNKSVFAGTAQDYVDFRNDNLMYTYFNDVRDTSRYEIKNKTTIIIDGDNATIRTLTPGQLVLYSKDKAGSIGYVEVIYSLRK